MVNIKIKKMSTSARIPAQQTAGASGYDLHADLKFSKILDPGVRDLIPTGIALEIPSGYEAQVRSRSGMALKNGVVVAQGIGTIDSDFRAELQVILMNTSDKPFAINHGDRIAQLVFVKLPEVELIEVSDLSPTERNQGGFGSTKGFGV